MFCYTIIAFPVVCDIDFIVIRDGPVNLVGGGGGSGRITSEQFFFCCYNRSANFIFLGMCRANFF